jgi:hypothetical protein
MAKSHKLVSALTNLPPRILKKCLSLNKGTQKEPIDKLDTQHSKII